jgi:hypothetical protein
MAKEKFAAITFVAKNIILPVLALAGFVFGLPGETNAQSRNLKTDESQQLLSLGAGLEWRGSEMGYSSILSYLNFEESSHLLWGGEFEMAWCGGFSMPSAYIEGGIHFGGSHVRFYAAPRIGVGAARAYMKSHNDFFERETSQRQFTFTVGGQLGVRIQGRVLGFGATVGFDANIIRQLEPSTDNMIVDDFNVFKNPLSVAVHLSYILQSGVVRRCGDYPWLIDAGYIIALGESTPRAYIKIGQSIRQSARWNGEWGLQVEENFSKDYSAAVASFEESFFLFGSRTWVRPMVGVKAGFGNAPVKTSSHAINGEEAEIWSETRNMQPGFVLGGYVGANIRLFSSLEAKVALDYTYTTPFGAVTNGYDQSVIAAASTQGWGLNLGLIYSF